MKPLILILDDQVRYTRALQRAIGRALRRAIGRAPERAIDGNPATIWHTAYTPGSPSHPHELGSPFSSNPLNPPMVVSAPTSPASVMKKSVPL